MLTLGNALERVPDNQDVYQALGRVWLDRAQAHNDRVFLSKALEALARVGSNPSASSATLTLYGRALLLDGQVEAAEHALAQACARYPVEPSALLLYATAAERQSHFDAARRALIDYTGLVPGGPDRGGRAFRIGALSLKVNDPLSAAQWMARASALAPDDVRVLAALADAQLRAGDVDAARATIARGLERDPANATLAGLARHAQ